METTMETIESGDDEESTESTHFLVPQRRSIIGFDEVSEYGAKGGKKKKKSFYKNVKITNPDKIGRDDLLRDMQERYKKKTTKWEGRVSIYSKIAFSMAFLILTLQVFQMVLLPMKNVLISDQNLTIITACITATSALIAGCQLKLKMHEKVENLKMGIRLYSKLQRAASYYLMMTKNGGIPETEDTIVLWQYALQTEIEDIPVLRTMPSL